MSRRPPSPFLRAEVMGREWLSPRLARISLAGPELSALAPPEPASSVRVLLPEPDGLLVLPGWDGNRFVLDDGRRPPLRTLTPLRADPSAGRLDLGVVVHGAGAASSWASTAAVGSPVAVSGPARGYRVPTDASSFVLGGDETAVPAISQILAALPPGVPVAVYIEVPEDARPDLSVPAGCRLEWVPPDPGRSPGWALASRVGAVEISEGTRLWVAGEAEAMQRIRQQLFNERGVARSQATIRGYWKHGRASVSDEEGPNPA